jgi:predicted kinase
MRTKEAMKSGVSKICVANTFTTEWEMKPYFELAQEYNYRIFTVVMENRHGGTNVHDVPDAVLQKQKSRFNIKL